MPALRLLALGLAALVLAPSALAQKAERRAPRSANPYTSFLPAGVEPDYAYWNDRLALEARERARRMTPMRLATVVHDEAEAAGASGANNTLATAEAIAGFGTGTDPVLTIRGDFPGGPGARTVVGPFPEEDGSIPDASDTGLLPEATLIVQGATIGDGAFGTTSGDFDFYAVTAPDAGLLLVLDIDTPTGGLDPTLTLFDAAGEPIAFNDDTDGLDSFLEVALPAAGTFYIAVASFNSTPSDVNDPGSGDGANTTGPYNLLIALFAPFEPDTDVFAIDLQAGDIIGVGEGTPSLTGIALYDPSGELRIGSGQDLSGSYPAGSPLPGGGASLASAAVVAPTTGRHFVAVTGAGPYQVDVRGFRPRLEADPGGVDRQTLFIDFDGATVDARATFGFGAPNAVLSPLADFLTDWGLGAADEDALIDAILAVVEEKLLGDLLAAGNNPRVDVEVLNSRDHADPFGAPGVSRLIVGGTIDELGIETIGIASSIDVGNFGLEDTAVTLLDLLSIADPNDDDFANSLNQYAVDPGATKIGLVAQGVGNITAHEAAHFLGLFHTDQFNATPNIIDQGGNLLGSVGVGADEIFGTADDVDVGIVPDEFVEGEGFLGIEDGTNAVAFGLSSRAPVSVAEGPTSEALRAFPNPLVAGAPLRVEAAAGARATLFDALGRRAATATADVAGALTLPTSGLAPGAYFVRLDDGADARVVPVTVIR